MREGPRAIYLVLTGIIVLVLAAGLGADPPSPQLPPRTSHAPLPLPGASGGSAIALADLPSFVAERRSEPISGDDRRLNLPGEGEVGPCNTQNEVSMARWDRWIVASWVDAGRCDLILAYLVEPGLSGLSLNGYAWSSDGGLTWVDRGFITPPPGWSYLGDPVLAAGPDGTFYTTMLATDPTGGSAIAVARSIDHGYTFPSHAIASVGRDPEAFHDMPTIAVDTRDGSPHRGTVYVAWTEFLEDDDEQLSTHVTTLLARSTDGARTFEDPVRLSTPIGPLDPAGIGVRLAIGAEGEVYAAWLPTAASEIIFTRSFDGGVTFESPPQQIARPADIGSAARACAPSYTRWPIENVLNGDIRIRNWISMAVDASGSADPKSPDYNPYRGRIYLVTPSRVLKRESEVMLLRSLDRGATWLGVAPNTRPDRVVNDDGTRTDQFHPQVAVGDAANVLLSWYDRRNDPEENLWMDVYATVSTDGGETFAPNVRVSDESFPPSRTNPNTNLLYGCYMGEYNATIAGDPGEFLLAWGDMREGPRDLPDPNVYFDRIDVG